MERCVQANGYALQSLHQHKEGARRSTIPASVVGPSRFLHQPPLSAAEDKDQMMMILLPCHRSATELL